VKEIGKKPIIQGSSFYFIFQKEKKRKEKVMTQRRFFLCLLRTASQGTILLPHPSLPTNYFLCKREDWCALSIGMSFGKDDNTN
jgi:hypothetical protein